MKTIVITGSSRGIGLGLAREFLRRGCNVVMSGRTKNVLDREVEKLGGKYGGDRVFGITCDVTEFASVQALWDAACIRFGSVDIWINNAGINLPSQPLWELAPQNIAAVVNTNLTGTLYGCKIAIAGMLQQGFGQIYTFEGHGSNDRLSAGMTTYGATKRAVRYLTQSLLLETENTPVQIGTISPGIVLTDLIMKQLRAAPPENREKNIKIFNILADTVETVTPWIAERVLANRRTGITIAWLTPVRAIGRFFFALFKKRNLFADINFE